MTTTALGCLVTAKAPVPGRVKTRLAAVVGAEVAAVLAAAALLDTIAACTAAVGPARCHLALDGDLAAGVLPDRLRRALAGWTIFTQEGDGFAQRLAHAHRRTRALRVVQVGMDTPQLSPDDLRRIGARLDAEPRPDVVLGPATDGGWWALAREVGADTDALAAVRMSTPDTCRATEQALRSAGLQVDRGATLSDVDTAADAAAVAARAPGTLFAQAWRDVERSRVVPSGAGGQP